MIRIDRRAALGALLALTLTACLHAPPTTARDAALPAVELGGYRFHAEAFGDEALPTLVVVHGGPGGDYAYLRSLAALSDEYRVVFYDQRGSGLSPREEQIDGRMDAFVADLDLFVERFGRGRPVRLVGHSWGAMIVSAYLGRHGGKVSHAVLAEPGILTPESARAMVREFQAHNTLGRKLSMLPRFVALPFVSSDDGHEPGDYIATSIMGSSEGPPYQCEGERLPPDSFTRAGYAVMKATVMPVMDDPASFEADYTEGVQAWAGKVLFLSGACSFLGPDFQRRYHLPRFPSGVEHRVIEGTGHNMFTLKPRESVAVVRAFLR